MPEVQKRIWKKYIYQGNPKQKREYKKLNMQTIVNEKENTEKKQIWGKFWTKKKYEKIKYEEILNAEENMKKKKKK